MSCEMERFKVTSKEADMEPIVPFDRFGLDNYSYELGWRTAAEYEKGAEAPKSSATLADTFDYTKQLEFHKQEVAEAEERGMPEAQVNYHLGRIALIEGLKLELDT